MKKKLESIIKRKILPDEDYVSLGFTYISYRKIDNENLEVHIGYDKNNTSYKEALLCINIIKENFMDNYSKLYNLVCFIVPENKSARIIAKKYGFIYKGDFKIYCVNGDLKLVSHYVLSKGDQNG